MLDALAKSLRSRYRQSLEKRTSALNPQTRADLAHDIHRSTLLEAEELHEVNASIEQAQLAFEDIEEKKRFVEVRLKAYQDKLQQRDRKLKRAEQHLAHVAASTEDEDSATRLLGLDGRPLDESLSQRDLQPPQELVNLKEYNEDGVRTDSALLQGGEETGDLCLSSEELRTQQMLLVRDQTALDEVKKRHQAMEADALALQKKIFVLERKREEILQKTRECRDFLVAAANVEQEEAEDDAYSADDIEEGRNAEMISTPEGNELAGLLGSESIERRGGARES